MPRHPPKHGRSSVGVTDLDGEVSRIWGREQCDASTVERLDRDATTLSG